MAYSNPNGYAEFHTVYAVSHAVLILAFSLLACVAITLRLWARKIQHLALSLSDYTIIIGLVSYLMHASPFSKTGRHVLWLSVH